MVGSLAEIMAIEPGLHDSLWAAEARPAAEHPRFEGERSADVAIIGGGFTGCSAALHLAEQGVDVVLLEAKEIGWGGSGRNGGLVNAGLWLEPDEVIKRIGPEFGPRFLDAFTFNTQLVFDLIEKHGIECAFDRKGVVRAAHSPAAMRGLEEHTRQWTARGAPIDVLDQATVRDMLGTERYCGGLVDHRSATMNPLGYARGLAEAAQKAGAAVHCASPVTGLKRSGGRWQLRSGLGRIDAGKVILATNAYSDDLWPGVQQSTIPIGCFVYASEPLGDNVRGSIFPSGHVAYDTQPAMYFSGIRHDRLVIGSLGYLPAKAMAAPSAWVNRVQRWIFPQLGAMEWQFKWAGTIGFTPDHIPRLHEPEEGLYMALGYNGRGIAPGTLWGKLLAERIMGKPAHEMPLPVTDVRPAPVRGAWRLFYETAFRAYRLRRLMD
jgi:glycine/D-amino acid oxidase-like deaminating enzyme